MENFDSGVYSEGNKEVEVDNGVEGKDGDSNAAVEVVENSVAATGVIGEPAMAGGAGEMEVGEGLKEEATGGSERPEISGVAEGLGEVKVGNENEAEIEGKKAEDMEESMVTEVEGVKEEEIDAADVAEEMQVTEVAEDIVKGPELVEETEQVHEIGGDNGQEVEEGHRVDGDNADETEQVYEIEGDNEDTIVGHRIEENIAEETEGHGIEENSAEKIEEGQEREENIADIEEGHELEENNAEKVEGHEIEENNAEKIEEGHEIEENNEEDIEEGHGMEGKNAEEVEEGLEIEENNVEEIEGHEIEGDDADEIEENIAEETEGHEIEENIAEETQGHEIEETNAEEIEEEHEIEGDNAEETEEVQEMEEDNEEEIEEGDNADAEEVEEGDNAEDIEMADKVEEVSGNSAGKRKRAKNAKATAPVRTSSRKKTEEDVCFICFDGGELVLCDRRGCPKAYHPTCVNRDDAFFRAKGRWNCGWHICSNCEKNAYYMCYTCTFSLCKGCVKEANFLCVRGTKGFCESCMKTVMLIEKNEQGNKETAQVDFDDRSSFEYLFKDYWIELKDKLSLTLDELSEAKNPWKGSEVSVGKRESKDELYDVQDDEESGSDDSSGNPEVNTSKRRRAKKRLKSQSKERNSKIRKKLNGTREASTDDNSEWASKELLEFVMHMRNGDRSVCSQFDVQALLLEYIKRNKLRDPRRKSQIICDSRLEKLFGKSRVGHFEMLKLLESHFLLKEDSQVDDLQGSVVDTEANQSEIDGSDGLMKGKDRRRKSRKKSGGLQSNLDDYAAIDTNNINLIYLSRSLVENLIDDTEAFHDKVVGAFVRIRISCSAQTQKQDLYRLVQVVGTSKASEPYKVGKKTTEFLLEILNLNKTEIVSIDIISNQDFTEDECKRLRQSIKCGLINRLTVGDIQEKAMVLQAVRVADALESEITRYSHLRDRASDMGRRKELRECVEKLQLLKSPGERKRRLEEIPEVHADPNMDPSYESEEDDDEIDDKKQENSLRSSSFNRRGRDPISPGRDSWSGPRSYSTPNRELTRTSSHKGFSTKADDIPRDGDMLETQLSPIWDRPKSVSDNRSQHMPVPSESVPTVRQEIPAGPSSKPVAPPNTQINETEKIWHYKDPSGKIQGPFSMVQLRKWNNTGYFPTDLRIWRASEKQDDSILLTDALAGNFHREPKIPKIATPTPLEISKKETEKWNSDTNLPSPTPAQAARVGSRGQPRESRWSPTPAPGGDPPLAATPIPLPIKTSNTPNSPRLPANVAVDLKNLQNLVHSVTTNSLASGPKPEMGGPHPVTGSSQPGAYGGYNSSPSFIAGNQTGQLTGQPPSQPIAPYGTSLPNNQTSAPRLGLENQNSGWGPIPNMGWAGPAPTNTNQAWPARPGPAPVVPNPGWTGQGQGWAGPPQGQPPANPYPGWAPGPGPANNQGWAPAPPGPQGNGGPSQPGGAKPNMGPWAGSNRRDGGPWNRQEGHSSRGGDSSTRGAYKGQRVCKYHESGHCRKGSACDYMHT